MEGRWQVDGFISIGSFDKKKKGNLRGKFQVTHKNNLSVSKYSRNKGSQSTRRMSDLSGKTWEREKIMPPKISTMKENQGN